MSGFRLSVQRVRALALVVLGMAVFCLGAASAFAEEAMRGVALVIGQSAYRHLNALPNPVNDAHAVSRLLGDLGFDVTNVNDADTKKLGRSLRRFAEDAEDADVALVYYSGHGIEAGGENFLLPVDADLKALDEAEDRLVPLSEFLQELQAAAPVTIVLLDACRSNPFPPGAVATVEGSDKPVPVSAAGLGTPRGAVSLREADAPAPSDNLGAVLGYAASPGHVALDGDAGKNSPYAAALLKHLAASGFSFSDVMTMVSEEVYLRTGAQQVPWVNSSLRRTLYFGGEPEAAGPDEQAVRGERRTLLLKMSKLGAPERAQIAATAKEQGVPMDALFAMLDAMGTKPPEDPEALDRLLREQAERVKGLIGRETVMTSANPEVARLSKLADDAMAEGAVKAAIAFREKAKAAVDADEPTVDEAEAQVKRKRLEGGAVYAQSARTYALAYDFTRAAGDFAAAFAKVEKWDEALAFEYKSGEAKALEDLGFFKGDDKALDRAAAAWREATGLVSPDKDRAAWAAAQSGLAMTLWTRADRNGDAVLLDQAAELLRGALEKLDPAQDKARRVQIEADLAHVLTSRGARESGTERLVEAAKLLRGAVQATDRRQDPLGWARLQNRLGHALLLAGERESATASLDEAAAAFRAALEERQRETVPVDWAQTANNLAITLATLGERRLDRAALDEATALYRAALDVQTRERAPLLWADTQSNLGTALFSLGSRRIDTVENFKASIAAFRLAAEEITKERSPTRWAGLQENIGIALSNLGESTSDPVAMREGIAALEAALAERPRAEAPLEWANTQNNLGTAWLRLARLGDDNAFEAAIRFFRAALEERTRALVPLEWAKTRSNLGTALFSLGKKQKSVPLLEQAAAEYRAALEETRRETDALAWGTAEHNLGEALLEIGNISRQKPPLKEARIHIEASRDAFLGAGETQLANYFMLLLAEVDLAEAQADIAEKLKTAPP